MFTAVVLMRFCDGNGGERATARLDIAPFGSAQCADPAAFSFMRRGVLAMIVSGVLSVAPLGALLYPARTLGILISQAEVQMVLRSDTAPCLTSIAQPPCHANIRPMQPERFDDRNEALHPHQGTPVGNRKQPWKTVTKPHPAGQTFAQIDL